MNVMKIERVYILAKNESRNIDGCIRSVIESGLKAVVLDSGSTDSTREQSATLGAEVRSFGYINHCESYNTITTWHPANELLMILDADMRIGPTLVAEIQNAFDSQPDQEIAIAPIRMLWDGLPLEHSNLCPPKSIVFKGGKQYFSPMGHGEKIHEDVPRFITTNTIDHDDQKPFNLVLANQWRYATELARRVRTGNVNWKDRIRSRFPLFMLATPVVAYIFKFGFLDGRAGLIYALDRLIDR